MIGTGGTALVTKVLGEGDKEKANRYFTMLIIFAVILGVTLIAIGTLPQAEYNFINQAIKS